MKRYYIEEEDGKEIKRKLTTFANDDLTQLSDDELETIYYESSAQFLAKAMHFMEIESELFSRKNVSDEILEQTGNNIIEAIKQVWQLLSNNEKWSYGLLKRKSGLKDKELGAALGWLSRENKIEFDQCDEELYVYLCVNVYIG